MEKLTELPIFQYGRSGGIKQFSLCISTRSRVCPERVLMYSNQSWPPVISPLGVHPCFRNATRAKQGCYRDWQGHTPFVSIAPLSHLSTDTHPHTKATNPNNFP